MIGGVPTEPQPLTSSVIAELRPETSTFKACTAEGFPHRTLFLWVLDFDACKPIEINQSGVNAAVKAFLDTEAYCPRPAEGDEDMRLWNLFGIKYLEASENLGIERSFSVGFLNGVQREIATAHLKQRRHDVGVLLQCSDR